MSELRTKMETALRAVIRHRNDSYKLTTRHRYQYDSMGGRERGYIFYTDMHGTDILIVEGNLEMDYFGGRFDIRLLSIGKVSLAEIDDRRTTVEKLVEETLTQFDQSRAVAELAQARQLTNLHPL